MFLAISSIIFLAAFFSPENIVPAVVGGLVALGFTQYLKKQAGWRGIASMGLAFVVSFVVAVGAVLFSTAISGGSISFEMVTASGFQIFSLATIAYNLMTANQTT